MILDNFAQWLVANTLYLKMIQLHKQKDVKWTTELGPTVARQPEGEVARQAKFFQPTHPTPNPIRDRSGRPDDMQDGRNTSLSQEIDGNYFNEELSSSDRTVRPVVSEDKMSLNVEQTHDRTRRPVTDTAAA